MRKVFKLNYYYVNNTIDCKFLGVPHTTLDNLTKISPPLSPCSSLTGTSTTSDFPDIDYTSKLQLSPKSPTMEFNSADVRNSLDRKTNTFNSSDDNNSQGNSVNSANNFDNTTDLYKNGPPISSNGALIPPPYRNPPSPKTGSPLLHQQPSSGFGHLFDHQRTDSQSSSTTNSSKILDFATNSKPQHFVKEVSPPLVTNTSFRQASPNIHINALNNLQTVVNNSVTSDKDFLYDNHHFQTAQYRELLQLIHYQREKISSQQVDISNVCFHFISCRLTL